jgi:hypothetical protein
VVDDLGQIIKPDWVGWRGKHEAPLDKRDASPGDWVCKELERLEINLTAAALRASSVTLKIKA